MYDVKPNLVIGFHGCERAIRDQLLNKPNEIIFSQQPYDWLGHGMYFWEHNYTRAFQWAEDKMKRGAIQNPAVIGAVLHLGYCCDFLDAKYIQRRLSILLAESSPKVARLSRGRGCLKRAISRSAYVILIAY